MKKYILFTTAILAFPLNAQAQMDHSMHSMNEGQGGMKQEAEKFVDPKDKKFPADYYDVETNPKVGQPIKKVVEDGQDGPQTNYGVQQVHDDKVFYQVMGDRLEQRFQQGDNVLLHDIQAWVGTDYDKLWLKSEGEYNTTSDKHEQTSVEALYSRNIASFWDLQAGYRHDFISKADDRDFAALGFQGLAPYWFEIQATSYISDEGDISAKLEAEYDVLLSQRLILQPRLETKIAVQDVEEYNIGSGITGFETGLRLRYEFSRKFAPYIGVSWAQNVGETKNMLEADGEQTNNTALVTGIKFWF